MKKILCLAAILFAFNAASFAQEKEKEHEANGHISVPATVKTSFERKYPVAKGVTWEKENGNYEANWGGTSGEQHSAIFSTTGNFVESTDVISVNELPGVIVDYVKANYKGAKITEASRGRYAKGNLFYEAEVNGKDLVFDEKGYFVK